MAEGDDPTKQQIAAKLVELHERVRPDQVYVEPRDWDALMQFLAEALAVPKALIADAQRARRRGKRK